MNIVRIIERKRDGEALTAEEIRWFVASVTDGSVPDYQVAALLMAIYLRGMSRRETVDLTLAMAQSGDTLDLHDVAPVTVDKHSSGGVGDKTTLVVQPMVAACGVPVAKMSGRGLGSSGGTLDKMESLPGWSFDMSLEEFRRQMAAIGIVLAGQTADLAPADGKLYALRDVTATISSIPLIAGSIMSKKLAAGADAIVLDVKVGNGAFMKSEAAARALAEVMVAIGRDAGRKTVALLSDMNQPLGNAVGNALEVKEALQTLRGGGPADFVTHCLEVGAHMLRLAGRAATLEEARDLGRGALANGGALGKFRQMVVAQGGDAAAVDDPALLPQAKLVETVASPAAGWVGSIDTNAIGWIGVDLGGGRLRKGDPIDHAVGLIMAVKVGDRVSAGAPLLEIHANDPQKLAAACAKALATVKVLDRPVDPLPHFHGVVGV